MMNICYSYLNIRFTIYFKSSLLYIIILFKFSGKGTVLYFIALN